MPLSIQSIHQKFQALQSGRVQSPQYILFPAATLKITLNSECTIACDGCFHQSSNEPFKRFLETRKLSVEQMKELILEAQVEFGVPLVEFSGGEPTLDRKALLELIAFCTGLGIKTRLITNGSLVGGEGTYKESLRPYLSPDLKNLSGIQYAQELKLARLTSVIVSIDVMHTSSQEEHALSTLQLHNKVPVTIVGLAIRNLMSVGFGFEPEENAGRANKTLRIGVTAAGDDYKPSFELVKTALGLAASDWEDLLPVADAKTYRVVQRKSGQRVYIHRNQTADIGFGKTLPINRLRGPLGETVYDRMCYHFAGPIGSDGGPNGELFVDNTGYVYTCPMGSYRIGSVHTHTLAGIVGYVNAGTPPKEYEVGVGMFRMLKMIGYLTEYSNSMGLAYQILVHMDPSLVEEIESQRSHSGACHTLGHSKKYLDMLTHFFENELIE